MIAEANVAGVPGGLWGCGCGSRFRLMPFCIPAPLACAAPKTVTVFRRSSQASYVTALFRRNADRSRRNAGLMLLER